MDGSNINSTQSTRVPELPHLPISPKKALLILAGFAIVLSFILTFSLRNGKKEKTPSPNNDVVRNDQNVPHPTQFEPPTTAPSLYADDFVTIDYPDGWVVEQKIYVNGTGRELLFKPKNLSKDVYLPSFDVAITTGGMSIKEMVEMYKKSNYVQTVAVIDNVPFIRLEGTNYLRQENGKDVDDPFQERIYLASIKGSVFYLRYLYDGSTKNQQQEEMERYFIEHTRFPSENDQ